MSDMNDDNDDTPHTKHINVFQVKETISSKNDINEVNNQPQPYQLNPPLYLQNQPHPQPKLQNDKDEIIIKSSTTDIIPTVEKDIKLEEADINQMYFPYKTEPQSTSLLDSTASFYIHCSQCLLILSTENKLQTESALYYLMSQPIMKNILQKPNEHRGHAYSELKCKQCGFLIGCLLRDSIKAVTSIYFLKKNISAKDNKEMVFSLLGIRSDLLLKLQSQLSSLFDKSTAIIDISKQTKDSLEKYTYPKERVDFLFIVHKMEGRAFLLGKNGFYNSVISEFNRTFHQNVFFVLLFKEIEDKSTQEYYNCILEDLITKGGQGELKKYKDSNHIICLNDVEFEKEVERKSKLFKEIYEMSYRVLSDALIDDIIEDNSDDVSVVSYYDNQNDEEQKKKDDAMLHNFIEYFYEGRNKLFANCLML